VGYVTSQGTQALCLRKPREMRSISDCDSDYAKDENDRKSISGRINKLGGMTTNWTSKKQQTVSLSSSEAEYQALSECVQEAVFTQNLLTELTGEKKPAIIYEDNLRAIFLVKTQQVSARTKHIDIRHHYMRELQAKKDLNVRFKRSEENPADIMTKNTTRDMHEKNTKNIRNGTLGFWKEDVTQDCSVVEFGTQNESQTIHAVCPAKSRIPMESPGSTSTTLGSNRTPKENPGSTSTTLGSNRVLKRSASTGASITSTNILLGAIKGASSVKGIASPTKVSEF
jgi:hypothetical protein